MRVKCQIVVTCLILCAASCEKPKVDVPVTEGWKVTDVRDFAPQGKKGLLIIAENAPGVSIVVHEVPLTHGDEQKPFLIVDGRRIELDERGSLGFSESGLSVYALPDLPDLAKSQGTKLGIEKLTPAGRRKLSSAAFDEAARLGFPVLPYPVPGQPFFFRLKTNKGLIVDSKNLMGRVVLIDCWATWCGPCMAAMPTLVDLSRTHGKELVLISVNVDDETEPAFDKLRAIHGPDTDHWAHVSVPKEIQPLLYRSLGRSDIPRILLIDRQGVLCEEPPNADFVELRKAVQAVVEAGTR